MRSGTSLFRITNGVKTYEGDRATLSKITGIDKQRFGRAVKRENNKVGEWEITELGQYWKYYQVWKGDTLDFIGTIKDIQNHYYLSEGYLYGQIEHGLPVLGEYLIKEIKDDKK